VPKTNWGPKETEYIGAIVGNETFRAAPNKISAVEDWP
jgi:hypothetical protein